MENKDIEIVEEEKEGIAIGDIFKRIWHAKITLGVTFAAVLVLGVVGIHYLYTKPNQVYSGSVTYQFRGASEGLYPNGTTFDYRSLIESSTLQTVKNSNSDYANIDIQSMIDKTLLKLNKRLAMFITMQVKQFLPFCQTISHLLALLLILIAKHKLRVSCKMF